MILPVAINKAGRPPLLVLVITCGYVLIALTGLQGYIKPLSGEFIVGSLAVALSFKSGTSAKQTVGFNIAAAIFALCYIALPAKSFLFVALAAAALCLAAVHGLQSSWMTFFSVIMMSPIFDYAASVFSFPIKLHLTELAAQIMRLLQADIKAEGNILVGNGFEFSVDTACLGLHMLSISMLAGLVVISWITSQNKVRISFAGIILCLLIIFSLNIISNLIRIICLVLWKIAPDNFMHEVVGLACFTLYVMAPLLYVVPLCLRFFAKNVQHDEQRSGAKRKHYAWMNASLLVLLAAAAWVGNNRSINGELIPANNITVEGFVSTPLEHRVTKLTNKDALVYIKPIAGFFSSDHQPMICWSGSGYEFTHVQEKIIGGSRMYTATLEKGNEQLYTAWWYDNGISTTISQFDWRWNALKSKQHYSIINVTAATPAMLETQAQKMLALKLGKRG